MNKSTWYVFMVIATCFAMMVATIRLETNVGKTDERTANKVAYNIPLDGLNGDWK